MLDPHVAAGAGKWLNARRCVVPDASPAITPPLTRARTPSHTHTLQKKTLVAPSVRQPVLSPLPHRLPLPPFGPIAISVTGYPEGQKATIKLLVEKLGGRLVGSFKPNEVTHLMVATLHGASDSTQKKVGAVCVCVCVAVC